ncbi:MAG: hypothetical protein ACPGSC_00080 [Granulosicoccaceae bacterium]
MKLGMRKTLIAFGLASALLSFSAHAGSQRDGAHHHHHSTTAVELVIAAVDDSNAANLRAQLDNLETLRETLVALVDADTQDQAAIDVAHNALKLARRTLRSDVQALVDNDAELQASVEAHVEAEHDAHHLVVNALRIDDNFALLLAAASEQQAASLVANQLALDAVREQVAEAREAGAEHSEIRLIRETARETRMAQFELASTVIEANDELRTAIEANAEDFIRSRGDKVRGGYKR